MANDRKFDEKAVETKPGNKFEGLVKVKKGDEVRHVHPTTLKNHLDEGWTHVRPDHRTSP